MKQFNSFVASLCLIMMLSACKKSETPTNEVDPSAKLIERITQTETQDYFLIGGGEQTLQATYDLILTYNENNRVSKVTKTYHNVDALPSIWHNDDGNYDEFIYEGDRLVQLNRYAKDITNEIGLRMHFLYNYNADGRLISRNYFNSFGTGDNIRLIEEVLIFSYDDEGKVAETASSLYNTYQGARFLTNEIKTTYEYVNGNLRSEKRYGLMNADAVGRGQDRKYLLMSNKGYIQYDDNPNYFYVGLNTFSLFSIGFLSASLSINNLVNAETTDYYGDMESLTSQQSSTYTYLEDGSLSRQITNYTERSYVPTPSFNLELRTSERKVDAQFHYMTP